MVFPDLVKAALELGVIPTLALFLVGGMFLQNRQLMKDRRLMEQQLLSSMLQVVADFQKLAQESRSPKLKK